MAKNSKPGKDAPEIVKFKKEEAETAAKQSDLEERMKKEEAAKLAAAQEESDNQAEPVERPNLDEKARKAAWKALEEQYAAENPEKYALKKAAGHFDKMPDTFKA